MRIGKADLTHHLRCALDHTATGRRKGRTYALRQRGIVDRVGQAIGRRRTVIDLQLDADEQALKPVPLVRSFADYAIDLDAIQPQNHSQRRHPAGFM